MSEQYAKYTCIVYPMNRHSGYGEKVIVIATSRQEAINRAVDIGWSGRDSDARVKIELVEDMMPVVAAWPPAASILQCSDIAE